MSDRPKKQLIDVKFYKPSGKYYTSGRAIVNHYLFEEGFKQDIVNTQNAMMDGWQEGDYYVVTSAPEHVNGFFEALFLPGSFKGLKKQKVSSCCRATIIEVKANMDPESDEIVTICSACEEEC